MINQQEVFKTWHSAVTKRKIKERDDIIDYLSDSFIRSFKKELSLGEHFEQLSSEDKKIYYTHLIKAERDVERAYGSFGKGKFDKFPFSKVLENFSLEDRYEFAKIHMVRCGTRVLKRYKLPEEQVEQLIEQAKKQVKKCLPDFSIVCIDDYKTTGDSQLLKFRLSKRFSGRYKVPLFALNKEELNIFHNPEGVTIEELKQVVSKAMQTQEQHLLENGWYILPYVRQERPKHWGQFRNVKAEDIVSFSHGGGFFHIMDFLKGKSQGYPLEYAGKGIQVTPLSSANERDPMYAERACNNHVDYPARLSARIKAKFLDSAPNGYEAGLRPEYIEMLEDIVVTRLDTGKVYTMGTTEYFEEESDVLPTLSN